MIGLVFIKLKFVFSSTSVELQEFNKRFVIVVFLIVSFIVSPKATKPEISTINLLCLARILKLDSGSHG